MNPALVLTARSRARSVGGWWLVQALREADAGVLLEHLCRFKRVQMFRHCRATVRRAFGGPVRAYAPPLLPAASCRRPRGAHWPLLAGHGDGIAPPFRFELLF